MGGYSLVPRPSNRPAFDQIPLISRPWLLSSFDHLWYDSLSDHNGSPRLRSHTTLCCVIMHLTHCNGISSKISVVQSQ